MIIWHDPILTVMNVRSQAGHSLNHSHYHICTQTTQSLELCNDGWKRICVDLISRTCLSWNLKSALLRRFNIWTVLSSFNMQGKPRIYPWTTPPFARRSELQNVHVTRCMMNCMNPQLTEPEVAVVASTSVRLHPASHCQDGAHH